MSSLSEGQLSTLGGFVADLNALAVDWGLSIYAIGDDVIIQQDADGVSIASLSWEGEDDGYTVQTR